MLVNLLENLIVKRFYEDKEEIQGKLNVFYAMNKIDERVYSDLTMKVEEVYFVAEQMEESMEVTENVKGEE